MAKNKFFYKPQRNFWIEEPKITRKKRNKIKKRIKEIHKETRELLENGES